MAASLGNLSLWLTLIFSATQFLDVLNKNKLKINRIKISVILLLVFSIISFLCLIYAYIISDFTVSNVFENSHTTKPLIYKISASWGNHEGSMLLWVLVLTVFNFFIFKLYNDENFQFVSKALETQSLIIFGFILFTILTSNPFREITPAQTEGLGFNPILQDPALAIHPPLLYIGYVGFSAVFSLSIATLCLKNTEKFKWHNYIKPFAITAWTFLTIGITFGSIWAYYELGWGGWWFWDPVENASFMPWLIGTALIHSLIVVDKKKSLQSWVILLSIIVFLLSVLGTFLVRSGILTSVHTFALDPERGLYILLFTAILGAYSLILYLLKSKKFYNKIYFSFLSKEGFILANNIIMVVVCFSVFFGTVYPLIVEVFTSKKISVGEPYFNSTVTPIMLSAILIMGVGPILAWKKDDKFTVLKKIYPSIILSVISTTLMFLIYKSYNFLGIVAIFLAFWIIFNNLNILLKKKSYSTSMLIAHFGIGILLLGITASSIWQNEKIVTMKINDVIEVNKNKIVFSKISEVKQKNYLALRGNFVVYNDHQEIISELMPENRFYPTTKIITTEASIHTNFARDLYIVLGDGTLDNGWVVKIYYNPLVLWIWIGAITIFFGGIISISSNLKKIKNHF